MPLEESSPLGGWHGHLFTLDRRQCVMLVHDATRYALFLPGLRKEDFAALGERWFRPRAECDGPGCAGGVALAQRAAGDGLRKVAVAGQGDAGGGGADVGRHAEDTMREREIEFVWLTATMDAPEATEQHPDDPTLIYAFRRIPEFGNRVLRVVYNQTKMPLYIATVYFDRTAGGKR